MGLDHNFQLPIPLKSTVKIIAYFSGHIVGRQR